MVFSIRGCVPRLGVSIFGKPLSSGETESLLGLTLPSQSPHHSSSHGNTRALEGMHLGLKLNMLSMHSIQAIHPTCQETSLARFMWGEAKDRLQRGDQLPVIGIDAT